MNDSRINIHDIKVSDEIFLLGRKILLDHMYEYAGEYTLARIQAEAAAEVIKLVDMGILDEINSRCFVENDEIKLEFNYIATGELERKTTTVIMGC